MQQPQKENSISYNQNWINKAIKDGRMNFIPVHKFPNKSIGEHIEIKYKQLYDEEFQRHYRNKWSNDYNHFISNFPKINQKNSLLYIRELILKTCQEGNLSKLEQILDEEHCDKELVSLITYQEEKLIRNLRIKGRMTKWIKNTK